jgi:hypothetical protein
LKGHDNNPSSRDRLYHVFGFRSTPSLQRKNYKVNIESKHNLPDTSKLLDQTFRISGRNRRYEVTLPESAKEYRLYLAGYQDIFTKERVGEATS